MPTRSSVPWAAAGFLILNLPVVAIVTFVLSIDLFAFAPIQAGLASAASMALLVVFLIGLPDVAPPSAGALDPGLGTAFAEDGWRRHVEARYQGSVIPYLLAKLPGWTGLILIALAALGITPAADLLSVRNSTELLVAGVKVATQTPAVRSGRRVIFLTLDDTTGLSDATFFEDVQGPYAATVFASWLLVVRGVMRRTGPRGRSLRATAAWDLTVLQAAWDAELDRTGSEDSALAAVEQLMAVVPAGYSLIGELVEDPTGADAPRGSADTQEHSRAGGMGQRRVLVHASGALQSPYADVKPSGLSPADAPRKLWHSSPHSSGR